MSFWDGKGFGEVYTADGCYVVRYEDSHEVEAWGPYQTERMCGNARRRISRGNANAKDRRLRKNGVRA